MRASQLRARYGEFGAQRHTPTQTYATTTLLGTTATRNKTHGLGDSPKSVSPTSYVIRLERDRPPAPTSQNAAHRGACPCHTRRRNCRKRVIWCDSGTLWSNGEVEGSRVSVRWARTAVPNHGCRSFLARSHYEGCENDDEDSDDGRRTHVLLQNSCGAQPPAPHGPQRLLGGRLLLF